MFDATGDEVARLVVGAANETREQDLQPTTTHSRNTPHTQTSHAMTTTAGGRPSMSREHGVQRELSRRLCETNPPSLWKTARNPRAWRRPSCRHGSATRRRCGQSPIPHSPIGSRCRPSRRHRWRGSCPRTLHPPDLPWGQSGLRHRRWQLPLLLPLLFPPLYHHQLTAPRAQAEGTNITTITIIINHNHNRDNF